MNPATKISYRVIPGLIEKEPKAYSLQDLSRAVYDYIKKEYPNSELPENYYTLKSREGKIIYARQLLVYIARFGFNYSTRKICAFFEQERTTVSNTTNTIRALRQVHEEVAHDIKQLERILGVTL